MPRVRRTLCSLAVALTSLAPLACVDSLHLDPEPSGGAGVGGTQSGGGGSSNGGGGAGGQAGGGAGGSSASCASNSDCTFPTSICDVEKAQCFECLEHHHCSFKPGTVCSLGSCECPASTDEYCPETSLLPEGCYDLSSDSLNCGLCGKQCYGPCAAGQCADQWEPTSTVGAPEARARHVAVAAGSTMIVWGGETNTGRTNTGGVYDHATLSWTATSLSGAPIARIEATAVWTGTQMIVWGGEGPNGEYLASGGLFDPASNTWSPMTVNGAPAPRSRHTAVWVGAPVNRMIVQGGFGDAGYFGDAYAYDPVNNVWTILPSAPEARRWSSAVYDEPGDRVLVFGGYEPTDPVNAYQAELLAYSTVSNGWSVPSAVGEPSPRERHTAVFDGTRMIVWGGYDGSYLATGGRFAGGGWLSMAPAPLAGRTEHAMVVLDGKTVVWGGYPTNLGDGAVYDPVTDTWESMPSGPEGRRQFTGVAVGDRLMVWGGFTPGGRTSTGGVFRLP